MSKPAFKLPERERRVDDWVAGEPEAPKPAKPKPTRLTIDLDPELHAKYKAATALRGTNMVDEIRAFIEQYTREKG